MGMDCRLYQLEGRQTEKIIMTEVLHWRGNEVYMVFLDILGDTNNGSFNVITREDLQDVVDDLVRQANHFPDLDELYAPFVMAFLKEIGDPTVNEWMYEWDN